MIFILILLFINSTLIMSNSTDPSSFNYICIIGRNLNLKYNQTVSFKMINESEYYEWFDHKYNQSLFKFYYQNFSTYQTNPNDSLELPNYFLNNTMKMNNTIMLSEININPCMLSDTKKISFSVSNNESSNVEKIFETNVLDNYLDCTSNFKISSHNRQYLSHSHSKNNHQIVNIYKNQKNSLFCSIYANMFNPEQKSNMSHLSIDYYLSSSLNSTIYKTKWEYHQNDGYFNSLFWNRMDWLTSDNDLELYQYQNELVRCRISNTNYFDNIEKNKLIKNLSCHFHLNIQFDPFIHPDVKLEQIIQENELSRIECPIKANNLPPIKYFMIWSFKNKDKEEWTIKLKTNYSILSDIYLIDHPIYEIFNEASFKCELLDKNSQSVLTSIIRIKVERDSNRNNDAKQTNLFSLEIKRYIFTIILSIIILIACAFILKIIISNSILQKCIHSNKNRSKLTPIYLKTTDSDLNIFNSS
jgi:hypothetical protein